MIDETEFVAQESPSEPAAVEVQAEPAVAPELVPEVAADPVAETVAEPVPEVAPEPVAAELPVEAAPEVAVTTEHPAESLIALIEREIDGLMASPHALVEWIKAVLADIRKVL